MIPVPANALVVLVGAAASGKSTWARSRFGETQIVSSDRCRALVADSEEAQYASDAAFAVFYQILRGRALHGRLSVADSTALHPAARHRLLELAREHGIPCIALLFHLPMDVLLARNATRERRVPEEVLHRQAEWVAELVREGTLEREGYEAVYRLTGAEEVALVPARTARPDAPPP